MTEPAPTEPDPTDSRTETGHERIRRLFADAESDGRAVLLPYLTAGLPSVEESPSLFSAMADAGADGFEVGIPYADPLMDGPVIMEAGERALEAGVTVDRALDVVRSVVDTTGKPVLVMTYVNPVLRRGIGGFFSRVAASGASGVIVADLPADEAAPFARAAGEHGLGLVLFVAPTTDDDRLEHVVASDPVFVYAIAEIGVTGERDDASVNIEALAERIRSRSDLPIVFGVGISTPGHASIAASHGDGVIVGTAVVRRVLEADSAVEAANDLSTFVAELRAATDVSRVARR
ncbi:MAG: tryptophan synthase subunit alpha [Acidimicrobiia bacterium]|nr:tryptophan synthase subunit alpha [Acidimicrobiia bacterium]